MRGMRRWAARKAVSWEEWRAVDRVRVGSGGREGRSVRCGRGDGVSAG